MPSSSPAHLDLSDPTAIYHLSQTSKTDIRNPRHAALASQFPEQFFGKDVATSKSPTATSSSKQTKPETPKPSKHEMKISRYAQQSEYFPEAYFGTDAKRKEAAAAAAKMEQPQQAITTSSKPRTSSTSSSSSRVDVFETPVHSYLSTKKMNPHVLDKRRNSIDSTATTATSSSSICSSSSTASTLAASKTPVSSSRQNDRDTRRSSEIDIFDYQAASAMSMAIDDPAQPYLRNNTSGKSSTSSSSSQSLWSKAKGKLSRKSSAGSETETEKEKAKAEKRQERRTSYEELDLEQKTKFGIKGGMKMVG